MKSLQSLTSQRKQAMTELCALMNEMLTGPSSKVEVIVLRSGAFFFILFIWKMGAASELAFKWHSGEERMHKYILSSLLSSPHPTRLAATEEIRQRFNSHTETKNTLWVWTFSVALEIHNFSIYHPLRRWFFRVNVSNAHFSKPRSQLCLDYCKP